MKAFEEAKKNDPSIIFIDEMDSIAPKRRLMRRDNSQQQSTLHGSFIGRPLPASEPESESEPCGNLRNLASRTLPKYSF
ncbi:hypothetical protein YC2023_010764 [Brassica napus]